jgi:hypothetical protein
MPHWQLTGLALLLLEACSSAPRQAVVSKQLGAAPGHRAPPPATIARADAEACQLSAPIELGAISGQRGRHATGFGERGGLVAWSWDSRIWVKPLSPQGAPLGFARELASTEGSAPFFVVPAETGFAVVGRKLEMPGPGCGRGRYGPCPDGSGPIAHVCRLDADVPCAVTALDVSVQLVDLTGVALGPPTFHTLPRGDRIISLSATHGASLALVTDHHRLVSAALTPSVRFASRKLETFRYLVPVGGQGPPSFLLLDPDGVLLLADEHATHVVRAPELSRDARQWPEPKLLANFGADAAIYVGWQTPRSEGRILHFGVIRRGQWQPLPDITVVGESLPFDDYVELRYLFDGAIRRSSWQDDQLGRDIELPAGANYVRHTWTGRAFSFVYEMASERERSLWTSTASCSRSTAPP